MTTIEIDKLKSIKIKDKLYLLCGAVVIPSLVKHADKSVDVYWLAADNSTWNRLQLVYELQGKSTESSLLDVVSISNN